MKEEISDNNTNSNQKELIQKDDERESDVKLEGVTDSVTEEIKDKKISSIQTIFSVWNTMIGSTLVCLPYMVYRAGLIPTIIISLLYGYICYKTCSIVVKLGGNEEDYGNVVFNYFNYGFGKKSAKFGKYLQTTFNLFINVGAAYKSFLIY